MITYRFDKDGCKAITEEIRAALAPVAARLGLKITPGGGSYDAGLFTLKVRIEPTGAAADKAEQELWDRYASSYGLKPEDLGASLRHRGTTFTIAGIRVSRSRFPIRCIGPGGEGRLLEAEFVRLALERQRGSETT